MKPMTDLKRIRTDLGLNRAEIARKCRVPYRTWIKWEDGERRTPEYAWVLLAWYMMGSGSIQFELEYLEKLMKDQKLFDGLTAVKLIQESIKQSEHSVSKPDSMVETSLK